MAIIIILAISAIASGIIASNNGMSVIAHVALGIVLGFIGTLITIVMASIKKPATPTTTMPNPPVSRPRDTP